MPSEEVRIVPESPTAMELPSSLEVTPLSRLVVGEANEYQSTPLVEPKMEPKSPTAT